ncbi:hypothetical protein [Tabrizicola sp.]|uniref:hypothetical protein n=1 Tax=Tabrizicola sp. TaxID=2005166 RepID=UPI003F2EC25E
MNMIVKHLVVAMVPCLFASSVLAAEFVVINQRYVVSKETIRGYFYRDGEKQIVFDVRWSDWSTQYRCQNAYDETKVEAASLSLAVKLKEASTLDFGEFLEGEGFTACEKF